MKEDFPEPTVASNLSLSCQRGTAIHAGPSEDPPSLEPPQTPPLGSKLSYQRGQEPAPAQRPGGQEKVPKRTPWIPDQEAPHTNERPVARTGSDLRRRRSPPAIPLPGQLTGQPDHRGRRGTGTQHHAPLSLVCTVSCPCHAHRMQTHSATASQGQVCHLETGAQGVPPGHLLPGPLCSLGVVWFSVLEPALAARQVFATEYTPVPPLAVTETRTEHIRTPVWPHTRTAASPQMPPMTLNASSDPCWLPCSAHQSNSGVPVCNPDIRAQQNSPGTPC